MAKTLRNWASKTETASAKQRQALASMVEASQNQDAKSWFKTLNWSPVEHGGLSKFEAVEERSYGTELFGLEEPKRSAKPKRKASPKVKKAQPKPKASTETVFETASFAKAMAFANASTTEDFLGADGQPLKGAVTIKFKGNTVLGKAFKASKGCLYWTVPQDSFSKAKAFADTFVELVGSKHARVVNHEVQC